MSAQSEPSGRVRLREILAPQRKALRRASALGAVAALLWTMQAALVALAFEGLLTGTARLAPLAAAAGFLAIGFVRAGLGYLSDGVLFRAAQTIVTRHRTALTAREALGESAGQGGPGALAALAAEKLDTLVPYITRYAPAQARTMTLPLAILAIAVSQSWAVAVIFLISGPLIPVFMALIGWAAQQASERQMDEIGSLNDLLVDRLAALADIRLLNAQDHVAGDFADAAEGLRARTMAVLRIAFLSSTVLELFAAIGVAMVAVWTGFSLLGVIHWGTWGTPLSPAAGIFLLLLAPDFYQPLRDLAAAWHDKAAAEAVARDFARWEAAAHLAILGSGAVTPPLPGPAVIAWAGLGAPHVAAYPDARIAPGETVALTGPSGAGKTTLLRLLAGLDVPVAGRIEVAGRALDASTADAWRARLGWMPQAPHFLNRSLAYNIGFGAPPAPEALRGAVLEDVIATLPQGDRTVLGETGGGLSGGEARRVTLARALQAQPEVLLADEPTADLDAETAALVTEGLLALAAKGATLIVATHDPRLIARLDRKIEIGGPA